MRLSEIRAEFCADDLLGVIFSRFSIGKWLGSRVLPARRARVVRPKNNASMENISPPGAPEIAMN
jgi:hypothetical protein